MRKYFIRVIWFALPLVFSFYIKPVHLLIGSRYEKIVAGNEIYNSVKKSKQKNPQKKILLGDSAGYQLFPNTDNDNTVISLACNQAIGMVGQYILLMNFFKAGNEIDTLYMIFGVKGFQNNLDQVYTFHYFLKPFYKEEYKEYFSEGVLEQIKKIPYLYLCREPYILTSNWAPKFECKDSINYTFLSPISMEYLGKIKMLSKEHNFDIIILSAPASIEEKHEIDNIDKNEIKSTGLTEEFETFFSNFIYLNDSCFVDGVHLKNPKKYSDFYKSKWIK
jgi:hypothetical protein